MGQGPMQGASPNSGLSPTAISFVVIGYSTIGMETLVGQDKSTLNKERHIKYWLRCLKTYLPNPYTSNDSNRMTLAFFIISALDLLGCLEDRTTQAERQGYVDWIYHCQRPSGGFRGFPATDFGDLTSDENLLWDPANLPATFFALSTLIILGDDFERLKRREILEWLPRLQRDNGGFGETVGEAGRVEGGTDSRFGYMAAGVRWMLRGRGGQSADGIVDVDVDRFVRCIDSSEVRLPVSTFSLRIGTLPRPPAL